VAGPTGARYVESAASASEAVRQARYEALLARRKAYKAAINATAKLHSYQWPRAIHVRLGFVGPPEMRSRLPTAGLVYQPQLLDIPPAIRPPVTALLTRNEEALRLELILLFASACLVPPGERPTRIADRLRDIGVDLRSLMMFTGLSSRNSALRIQRGLRALALQNLLKVPRPGTRHDYSAVRLNAENRNGKSYVVPGSRGGSPHTMRTPSGTLAIPLSFFLNGWHLVLTGPEIATYLMLLHADRIGLQDDANRAHFVNREMGGSVRPLRIYRQTRLTEYQLSDDGYAAHRELAEFGLIMRGQRASGGRRGRTDAAMPSGFWFLLNEMSVLGGAFEAVEQVLSSGEPAPHLRRVDETTSFLVSAVPRFDRPSTYRQYEPSWERPAQAEYPWTESNVDGDAEPPTDELDPVTLAWLNSLTNQF